eukprot:scaffold15278_cov129-Isochrysis_galbana.AAC.2
MFFDLYGISSHCASPTSSAAGHLRSHTQPLVPLTLPPRLPSARRPPAAATTLAAPARRAPHIARRHWTPSGFFPGTCSPPWPTPGASPALAAAHRPGRV